MKRNGPPPSHSGTSRKPTPLGVGGMRHLRHNPPSVAGRQPHRNHYTHCHRRSKRLIGMAYHGNLVRQRHTSRALRQRRENRFVGRGRVLSVGPSEVQHGTELYQRANEPQAVTLPPRQRGGGRAGLGRARHAFPLGWVARQGARETAALTASGRSMLPRHYGGRARADCQLNLLPWLAHRRSKPRPQTRAAGER